MMKITAPLSLLFSLFLLLHTTNAFNITKVLDQFPDFSTFNSYLSQTHLAEEINHRQTITILAVENSNLSPLSGKPLSVMKNIMSIHVVLDYYDLPKLTKLSNNSAILTTLYQTTGQARNHQGFINVTKQSAGGSIMFGSAAPGSPLSSNIVKMVTSQPYDLSVIQVSNVIVPDGMDSAPTSPAPKATPPPPPPAPKESPPAHAPKESPPAPTPKKSKAPAPSRKVGPAPKEAETPAPVSDGPTADAPVADKEPADKKKSGGVSLDVGLTGVLTMVLSTLYLASRI